MKKNIADLEKLLYSYLKEIFEFESAISAIYNLDGLPFDMLSNFPSHGTVTYNDKKANYRYHGIGCSLTVNGIEIEYSVYADRVNYIVISPWDFLRYIQTANDTESKKNISLVDSTEYFELLEKQNILAKIFEDYQVCEISLSWYKNYRN